MLFLMLIFRRDDMTQVTRCNWRSCLDRKGDICTAKEIDIVNGRCSSISQSCDTMRSVTPPMERKHGSMMNKKSVLK